jgi:hypothetical protein
VACAYGADRTCHGNIDNLNPSGNHAGGVGQSNADAQHDEPYLNGLRSCYQSTADQNCIQASVIAAIASRESRGGSLLESTGGYGDFGQAWGIMQCDLAHSGLNCKECWWNSCCHIQMMVSRLLVPYINQVKNNHGDFNQDMALQGGVAAYNSGVSTIQSWGGVDSATTGRDYSNDVIARAKWFKAHGWN